MATHMGYHGQIKDINLLGSRVMVIGLGACGIFFLPLQCTGSFASANIIAHGRRAGDMCRSPGGWDVALVLSWGGVHSQPQRCSQVR